jgi:K+-transporting ATPase ATPase A chain
MSDPASISKPDDPGEMPETHRPMPGMFTRFGRHARLLLLLVPTLTLLTGILYPLVLAGIARQLFPHEAGGSLVEGNNSIVGSELIGQNFAGANYFHPRPSAAGEGYDATASSGTNFGPNNPKLRDGTPMNTPQTVHFMGVGELAAEYRRVNGLSADDVLPADAVTRSGSGLDPHISPANASLQVFRVARERGRSEKAIRELVAAHTQGRQFGILGQSRVNVFGVNRALDTGIEAPKARSSFMEIEVGGRWSEYVLFLTIVLLLARPVGSYLARVFERQPTFPDRVLLPLEKLLHRFLGVRPEVEMSAGVYFLNFLAFGIAGFAFLFVLLLIQGHLPSGPGDKFLTTPMTTDLAANTAVSFATTTTWQAYGGETTLRYLTQVVGLTSQGFLAGAAGLAVGVAFIRGFAREHSGGLGNFGADVIRALLWVLLPLAIVLGVVLVWQGVPLNHDPYVEAKTLEGGSQVIALGPVAALEPIKNLGTNGGGFFNTNSAHPFANPTPLTNFLGLLAIVVIPAALTVTFGRMTGRIRAGRVLLSVMVVLFGAGLVACDAVETSEPSYASGIGVSGGNMEGKEVRFGVSGSVLAAVVTSNGATGSNNSMHGSFHPIGVLVLLINMMLGEVAFGGLGSGLYSLVMAAMIGVFLGGLMIGRTPEYLGKTLGIVEAKLVALYALLTPTVVLALTGVAAITVAGRAGPVVNDGSRAFTEILFAYSSCMANNGQSLAGLNANSPFYNATTIIVMIGGRFGFSALALALAGRFAAQGRKSVTYGSLPCDTPIFGLLVLGAVILIGALCFFPALFLGPMADHLQPLSLRNPH